MNTSFIIRGLSPYKKRCLAVSCVTDDGPRPTIVLQNRVTYDYTDCVYRMENNLFLSYISLSTSENSDRGSVNKSLNNLLANTLLSPPLVVQYDRHHVMASPLK